MGEESGAVRRGAGGGWSIAIDCRVETWVVIHLELAIELKSASSSEGLTPQQIETAGQIRALFEKNGKASLVALCVVGCGVCATGFLASVIDLQGQDREP